MPPNNNDTVGASPGSLIYVGPEIERNTTIKVVHYDAITHAQHTVGLLSDCAIAGKSKLTHWLDVDGIHEAAVVAHIGQQHNLHPLLLEDVMNTSQKPKIEYYNDTNVFVVLKMLNLDPQTHQLDVEHVSLVLGKNYVISFQEQRTDDIFAPILQRIQVSAGKTRKNGADYLFFSLIDLIVDHYFLVLDTFGEKFEKLEDAIISQHNADPLKELYNLKRELNSMRKAVWPVREMIGTLLRDDSTLIKKNTLPYLRDLHDHAAQVIETIDSYREMLTGLMELHYSILSNRMNSVMKTLTIISAIFIPLSFIAGVYGMNFDNMPELHWPNGYFYTLALMSVVAGSFMVYFKRRGWL